MKNRRQQRRARAGFTLFEIMIVVGIIIVLAGATVYKLRGNLDVAKQQRVTSDLSTISTQLRTYELQNNFLPTNEQGLKALVEKPSSPPVPPRWIQLLSEMPLDPWGMPYIYRYPGIHNPQGFDIYSLGADRQESADDVGNWEAK